MDEKVVVIYLPIRITFYILCQIPARRGRVGLEVPILGKPFFPITHCFIFRSNVTLSILSKIVILINFIYFKLECKGCLINIVYEKISYLGSIFQQCTFAYRRCLRAVIVVGRRYPLEFLKSWVLVYYWTRRY